LLLAFCWLCLFVTSTAAQTPAAKTSAAKTPAAKTSAAKTPAAKTSAAKTPAAKTSAAKTPAAKKPAAVPDKPSAHNSAFISENSNLPPEMLDVMQASRVNYLEGSILIRTGNSEKARDAFDRAVDIVLKSKWNLATTPSLNNFFQDLIKRIQEDESRYLLARSNEMNEEDENAVMDILDNVDLASLIADTTLREALSADLANNKYGIPITINEMVLKSLDYWLNRGRQYFINGLQRSGQYRPIIEKVFKEESIPLDLMYLAQVESLFRTDAVSTAKAKGIWQFEKETAIRYGLKVTRDVDERSDPEKSTRAAARYLNDLFAMFKDWNLVLAAYNWGEGKVQRLIYSTGLSDFWQLADLKQKLPEETKKHVPMIQASVILAKNPENYGLPIKLDPPLEYIQVSVSKSIDLRAAAKVLRTSIDELKKLNPALRGNITPANYPNFQLKVPADSDPSIHKQLAALPVAKIKPPMEYDGRHKVRQGETLTGIAALYHVSVVELEKANSFSSKKTLIAGTWLQVPSSGSAARTPAARTPAAKTPAAKTPAAKTPAAKTSSNSASSAKIVSGGNQSKAASAKKTSSAQVQSASSHAKTDSSGKKPDPKTAEK
jgi:membrane-bound lytic murein transglycosylase D